MVLVALDEEDVSQVAVFTPDRRLIAVVKMNERIAPFGADVQALRESIRTVNRARGNQKKARRTAADAMKTPQQVLRERQVKALTDDGSPPPEEGTTIQPVRTAFEAVSSQVGTLRKAAGAESMSVGPGAGTESLDDLVRDVGVARRQAGNLDELVMDVEPEAPDPGGEAPDPGGEAPDPGGEVPDRTDAFTLLTEAINDDFDEPE